MTICQWYVTAYSILRIEDKMNNKKFCFIMCTNDASYMEESISYIRNLQIPEGYEIDILTIEGAHSMTAGYNEGMNSSDAKYKIYLHHDVMIVEPDFLFRILEIFEHPEVGMIGMVGVTQMPANGIMWYGKRIGQIWNHNNYESFHLQYHTASAPYESVEAIDGLLMATQYDLPWREDLFTHWDFYDASQSFEFRRAGYQVVVPYMEQPWVLHDDGFMNLKQYYDEREIFVREYNL